jgi:hypothetical protein
LRIREEGLTVLGFGEQKTPEAFRNACHKFIFTEVLRPVASQENGLSVPATETAQVKSTVIANSTALIVEQHPKDFPREFILQALEKACDDTGWAKANFGSYLTKLQSDFDPRHYGFKKLSELIKAKTDLFELEKKPVPGSDVKVFYVRAKQA